MADYVKEYYGEVLQKSEDLKTNACCTVGVYPKEIREILKTIHPDVLGRYYGCGLTVPKDFSNLRGLRVLDLGSGSGRDCYILSKLVGEEGSVVGVDMTENQLKIASKYVDYHTKAFGYEKPNVRFVHGYIEKLDEIAELKEESFDLIISNCVINLSPDKRSVLSGVYRLLKTGGEFYFSDVYSDRRIPKELTQNPVLWGECLGGALYWNDFLNLSRQAGFIDSRLVEDSPISIQNDEVEKLIGHIRFYSATYRLFKLEGLEKDCEDYGQAVVYNGGIASLPHSLTLDIEHTIETGKVFPVCGNTLKMLSNTRFSPFFQVIGDGKTHFGIFAGCGKGIPFASAYVASEKKSGGSCC